jgi:ADP-heptose:LPS heptosyltransferase
VQLAQLDSFRAIPGVKFFSLQQGDEAAEADAAPFPIEPLSARTAAVHDAAAAMLRLDLIITVDSMPAHLAGALGRPVWLLLQHSADWRWIDGRDDSPWYPTMRIFRQPSEGDWAGAIERMKRALEELAASRGRGLLQPSSCGL